MKAITILNPAILVCFTTIFLSCANKDKYEDERKNSNLKGPVKSCFAHSQDIDKHKDTRGENGIFLSRLITFNRKGQVQKIEYYDARMNLYSYSTPIRENGKITEEVRYLKSGKIESKKKYDHISDRVVAYEEFDEEGNILLYGKSLEKDLLVKSIHTHINKNTGDTITNIYIAEFNKKGDLIASETMNKAHKHRVLYDWYEYIEFDVWDNWTKRIYYFGEGRDDPRYLEMRDIKYYW